MITRTLILVSLLLAPSLAQASLANLTRAEKSYYEKVFNYSMETTKPDETYDWESHSGKGRIRISEAFVSKSGSTCRNYSEGFNINGIAGEDSGVGCKRKGSEGWCKLRGNNALTCAMEKPADFYNVRVPNVNVGIPSANVNIGSGGRSGGSSGINTPGAPQVDAPKAGDISGQGYADTVTGAAGSVAGPTTSGVMKWFDSAFR